MQPSATGLAWSTVEDRRNQGESGSTQTAAEIIDQLIDRSGPWALTSALPSAV